MRCGGREVVPMVSSRAGDVSQPNSIQNIYGIVVTLHINVIVLHDIPFLAERIQFPLTLNTVHLPLYFRHSMQVYV